MCSDVDANAVVVWLRVGRRAMEALADGREAVIFSRVDRGGLGGISVPRMMLLFLHSFRVTEVYPWKASWRVIRHVDNRIGFPKLLSSAHAASEVQKVAREGLSA